MTRQIGVRLPQSVWADVHEIAERDSRPLTWVLVRLIALGLRAHRSGASLMEAQ